MKTNVTCLTALALLAGLAGESLAVQFPILDPGYVQEIYTGPLVGGPGMAWTVSGNLLTRNGADILEYSPTQNVTHQGTNLHGTIATHTISGLNVSGYGMVTGADGLIYASGVGGLQRFDPGNWALPAQSLAGTVGGTGYGVTLLQDGRIAYNAGGGNNQIYLYNPSGGTNTLIYTSSGLIDDIEAGPGGLIALAGQTNSELIVINSSGTVLSQFNTTHYPDGLAFGDGVNTNAIFSNNNDGTITRYSWASGILGNPTSIIDIAGISGAYGDLASVGPDCAFYVTQFENGSYHGAQPGVGTHWDNLVTNAEPSIVRIALAGGADGLPAECGFFNVYENLPEPATFATVGLAAMGLLLPRRRRHSAKALGRA